MGAWIEIGRNDYHGDAKTVAPLVGAWIEIENCKNNRRKIWSLPLWERGLKSDIQQFSQRLSPSLPLWERGLKYCGRYGQYRVCRVAPLVGAWIEMMKIQFIAYLMTRRSPCGSVD